MILEKLYQDITVGKYTDITIVFSDNKIEISVNLHKIILGLTSEYFDRLFKFGVESDKNVIKIFVDNAKIAYDVIMSIYGHNVRSDDCPDWLYMLKRVEIRSYFLLSNDVSDLYNLDVPADHFDYFLKIAEIFEIENDRALLSTIRNNIPPNYQLEKLTTGLIVEMLNLYRDVIIYANSMNEIKMIDMINDELLLFIPKRGNSLNMITCMTYSNDDKWIVTGHSSYKIIVWDAYSGKKYQKLIGNTKKINALSVSKNNKWVASAGDDATVKVWEIKTGKLLHTFSKYDRSIVSVAFSPDNKHIVCGTSCSSIHQWNIETDNLEWTCVDLRRMANTIMYSPNGDQIVAGLQSGEVAFVNSDNGCLFQKLRRYDLSINIMAYSNDGRFMLSVDSNPVLNIWDPVTGLNIASRRFTNDKILNAIFSEDGEQVIVFYSNGKIAYFCTKKLELIKTINRQCSSNANKFIFIRPRYTDDNIYKKLKDHLDRLQNE